MRTSLQFLLTLVWLALTSNSLAKSLPDTDDLHQHPAWLTLIHYQPDRFGSGYTSQADDDRFFLSDSGVTSPKAELDATLKAILQPGDGDDHARCIFPARDRWLRQKLDLPRDPADCPAYEEWAAG
jgi:hypothetical protein